MATTVKARGQITIVDLNDAKQIQVFLENSGADTQLYNPDTKVYTPSYASNPITLTPKLFVTGLSDTQIAQCSGHSYTINGTAADGTNYVVGTNGVLTIKKNLDTNSLAIVYTCTYTDPDTKATTTLKAYKTITRSQSAGALFTAVITAPSGTVFDTAKSTSEVTAKATVYRGGTQDTSGTTFKWYKLDVSTGNWTQITATASGTGVTAYVTLASNVSTLHVLPDDVLNFQTYKVIATDDGNTSEAYITFQDMTDPYQVEVGSTTGDKIVNGTGFTSVFARVYRSGELVESETTENASRKFTYTWTKHDKNGAVSNWSGTSSSTKTGNPITVLAADVSVKCTIFCEVTEN